MIAAIGEPTSLHCYAQQARALIVVPTELESGCRSADTTIPIPRHRQRCVERAGEPGDTIVV